MSDDDLTQAVQDAFDIYAAGDHLSVINLKNVLQTIGVPQSTTEHETFMTELGEREAVTFLEALAYVKRQEKAAQQTKAKTRKTVVLGEAEEFKSPSTFAHGRPRNASKVTIADVERQLNEQNIACKAEVAMSLLTSMTDQVASLSHVRELFLFESLDSESRGHIDKTRLQRALFRNGLLFDDPRLETVFERLSVISDSADISFEAFCGIIDGSVDLIERALQGFCVIPDFPTFCKDMAQLYRDTEANHGGDVARYIPQLARVDPEQWGVSVCTVDGQRFSIGDSDVRFCVQSTSKPISYCLALEEFGQEVVHSHVGREPSGESFNALTLDRNHKPHNPMINAGAIMTCSLIKPDQPMSERFDYVTKMWTRLAGGKKIGFNNAVYLSERDTADRNFALGYFMQEHKAFPEHTNLEETLEFYFQNCSLETTTAEGAVIAATLANGGVCPVTNERIFNTETVKNCLSLMYSCGMYDFSGEFAFSIGLPAKSGVAGSVMLVVPNVMGICVWSPRLDHFGNSVRGVEFCTRLANSFAFHNYDSLIGQKKNPLTSSVAAVDDVARLTWACSKGDFQGVKQIAATGLNVRGAADYDGRTPLHLAAAGGHLQIVRFLVSDLDSDVNYIDRWGCSPLDEAVRNEHDHVASWLRRRGALSGKDLLERESADNNGIATAASS